jgi:hypothetical protein
MVPSGYWTDARTQTICKVNKNKVLDSFSKNEETEEKILKIKGTDKSATISSNELFSIGNKSKEVSFKKAVYETPDLFEVAKRDGSKLTSEQQMMLLNVLLKNAEVFKGGRGYYNGEPVGIKLKPDAKPFRAKPYPMALKNWEVMEHELDCQ